LNFANFLSAVSFFFFGMRILLFWLVVLIQLAVLCQCFVVLPSPAKPPVQAPSIKPPTTKVRRYKDEKPKGGNNDDDKPHGGNDDEKPKGGKPTVPQPPTGQRILTLQPTTAGQSTESNTKGLPAVYIVAVVAAVLGATGLVALLIYIFQTKMAIPQSA
jgi:hypothetical protein